MTRGQLLLDLEVGFVPCRRVQVCAVEPGPIGLCGSVGQSRTASGVVATGGEAHSDLHGAGRLLQGGKFRKCAGTIDRLSRELREAAGESRI